MKTLHRSLISFITAGFPSLHTTREYLHLLSEYSDVIEIGLPFSDPVADGRVIQLSDKIALREGVTAEKTFRLAQEFKEDHDTPLILMTYFNPVFRKGTEAFVDAAHRAGFDAMIVVDLPIDHAEHYLDICRQHNVKSIFMATPITSLERLKIIDRASTGFVYMVSHLGITGSVNNNAALLRNAIKRAKGIISNEIAVGFGIESGEEAATLMKWGADGVVVGSALINIILNGQDPEEDLRRKLNDLRKGVKQY